MNEKLVKIQQALKAPKGNYNSFAKYNYRSAEDILEAVKPLVHAEGLTLTISDEVVNIGDSNYVKATVFLSDGKGNMFATAYAREEVSKKGMDTAQITGSTSSYARKYALNGMFAIDDGKDADSQDNTNHVSEPAKSYPKNQVPTTDKSKKYLDSLKHQISGSFNFAGLNQPEEQIAFIEDLIGKRTIDTIDEAKEVLNEAQALGSTSEVSDEELASFAE